MKNTVNIFEELNKMKNLIHVKRGTVISEQSDPFSCIKSDLDKKNIEFTIQPSGSLTYKVGYDGSIWLFKANKTWSQADPQTQKIDFTGKWECTGDASFRIISNDQQQWLSSDKLGWVDIAETSSDGGAKTELTARQKNINFEYCNVKNGKIENAKSSSNGMTWESYVSTYKITAEEIAAAKATCPNVVVPNVGGRQTGPTPTQRFVVSSQSLGIQNPKMDIATLQTILNTLNKGGTGLTESKNLVNEELNIMKFLLGYQRGKVISEQDTATQTSAAQVTTQTAASSASTPKDLIIQIQTVLKDKFKQNLGTTGADGKWGNFSQTALENALKTIGNVSQRRAAETQQTSSQDSVLKSAEAAKPALPGVSLPTQPGIQQPSK